MTQEFAKGERVELLSTGEQGVVRTQFADGYVSLKLDNGQPAEFPDSSLKKVDAE